jgi:small subunit ribosomal protein S20
MPHKNSAKKALRQSHKVRLQNRTRRSSLRSLIRKFTAAVEGEATAEEKQQLLRLVTKKLDQSAAKHLIHRNKAARTKSRLTARLNKSTG